MSPSTRSTLLPVVGLGLAVIGALVAVVIAACHLPRDAAAAAPVVVLTVPAPYQPPPATPAPVSTPRPADVVAAADRAAKPIGDWTPQRGVQIAKRALAWLSWPYSFGGGDASGPTYGTAVDEASRNDGHIRGFDCSGLVLYALAPWRSVAHFAATQYTQAGSLHPSLNELQPGDLIFWSKDGTIDGIGHVAIYLGNGRVVQAPHSGATIDVVPINQVESGRIGVTRPLT